MGPTWGPPGSCRPQMGPMLAPWTLLSGFGSDNGLAPNRHQSIIWNNACLAYWHRYTSLGSNEFFFFGECKSGGGVPCDGITLEMNPLKPRQLWLIMALLMAIYHIIIINPRHFADDIFRCIRMNENRCIFIQISLKSVLNCPISNKHGLVQVKACYLTSVSLTQW